MRQLLLLLAIGVSAFAQSETAILVGRVTDPSGLGVPGAETRLTRNATGAVRQTVTSVSGEYRLDLLEPDDYTIRVTAPGFKTFEDAHIHLQVAQASSSMRRWRWGRRRNRSRSRPRFRRSRPRAHRRAPS